MCEHACMCLFVYLRVCMYVRMVCMCARVDVCKGVCLYAGMVLYVCLSGCMYVCMC